MKALIISIISMAVLIAGWGIFVNYSDKSIHKLMNSIEDDILVNVNAQEWDRGRKTVQQAFQGLAQTESDLYLLL